MVPHDLEITRTPATPRNWWWPWLYDDRCLRIFHDMATCFAHARGFIVANRYISPWHHSVRICDFLVLRVSHRHHERPASTPTGCYHPRAAAYPKRCTDLIQLAVDNGMDSQPGRTVAVHWDHSWSWYFQRRIWKYRLNGQPLSFGALCDQTSFTISWLGLLI